ncbi:uncharacterized protein LOC144659591 isoform X2 [Oculina patagonica]
MAPLRGSQRCSSTTADIYHFILYASFLLNHNPLLLVGLCFQSLCAGIQYLFLCTAQTGSQLWKNLGAENPENRCSYSSEVHDDDSGKPYVFSTGKRDLKSTKRLIELDDRGDFAFESKSVVKTVECTAHAGVSHVKNVKNRFDLQDKFSLPGIQDIMSQLATTYESKNLNIAVKKEGNSFFPGFALPSFWPAGEPGISSRKGTDLGDEDMNLHVPLTGKAMKVPEEHGWPCFQQETSKLKTASSNQGPMHTPTKQPADGETTQEKSSDATQKGGQTLPDSGKQTSQASKSLQGSSNYSRSSSGSGGDDGDDNRKRNVPTGGCQADGQCCVDDNEEPEQQRADQSHKDDDYSYNRDSMSTPATVPSDTGTTQGNKASNPKECQTASDGGKTAALVSKKESTSSRRSSNGNGGDDGDDDKKKNVPTGGCQGDIQCDVENEKENEQKPEELHEKDDGDDDDDEDDDDDDDNQENRSLSQMSEDISVGGPAPDSTKKSTSQGLRIDVTGARMIAEASRVLPDLPTELQEGACGPFLSDQFNCRNPDAGEIEHSEAEQRLHQAFKCRRNLNSENEWLKCDKASCQEIQGFLDHSQNCHMRVLGGCDTCIHFKNILLYHASRCRLPLGQCVVPKCDYIREYAKTSSIPDNRKWNYKHDQLFFRRTPPATPTAQESQPSFAEATTDFHELIKQLEQAEFHEGADHQPSDGSSASFSGESLHDSSGAWNQYHVDRPPDLQVARGPTVTEHIKLEQEQHEDDVQAGSVAPLSATCMPVRDTSQTAGRTTQEERGEVIWPLNKEKLSVGEDGTYLEEIHWRSVRSIGGGACGRCFLCTDLHSEFLFAIKKIPGKKFESDEIEIWGSLSGQHPNILELYGAVKYCQTVIIFMEYMSGGSVDGVVEEYGRMNELLAVHILGKVISAVEFMHSQGILHRDIKGGNVLLDETGHQVKLADFGMSIRCDSYLQDNNPRGTEAFMAPEVCRSEYHSFSADIWSLMCLLHQMLAGKPPWMEFCHGSLLFKIGTASEPPQSPSCSPEVEDLFSQGFVLAPAERATAAELLRHQVFVSAPRVPYITLPSREEPTLDLDEESSFSSNTSGSETGSLVSDPSSDPFTTGCAIGNYDDDDEDDNEGDSDVSDHNDDSSNGFQGLDESEGEDAIFMAGPWQGLDMSAEQQLQSLQSGQILSDADMASMQPMSAASVTPEWSYSITDLTKLHIKDSTGTLVFTIRERPTTTYGSLGEEHHGNIASVLKLDAFSLTRDDGTPLNVRAEIGSEEQAVRVVRAHDIDNWQSYRWRVDVYGRVEQFFEF